MRYASPARGRPTVGRHTPHGSTSCIQPISHMVVHRVLYMYSATVDEVVDLIVILKEYMDYMDETLLREHGKSAVQITLALTHF